MVFKLDGGLIHVGHVALCGQTEGALLCFLLILVDDMHCCGRYSPVSGDSAELWGVTVSGNAQSAEP